MVDRSIPFFNLILRCDRYDTRNVILPDGFSVVSYQPGFENNWAELEYSLGDFSSVGEAKHYFVDTYLQQPNLLYRLLFALNPQGNVIGSCIAWEDDQKGARVSSLHWLVVDEHYQEQGIGRALCVATMNLFKAENKLPVYIHTQPWSWKAILLYLSLGFEIQTSDTFSHYKNDYEAAMRVLSTVIPKNMQTQEFNTINKESDER